MKRKQDAGGANVDDHERVVRESSQLLIKALPLATRVQSDEFTADERERLRERSQCARA